MSMITPGPVPGRRKHGMDRLATGNPVYGMGSPAATSGTVDPSGYVERGRRSGLARSLLARYSGTGAQAGPPLQQPTPQQPGGDGQTGAGLVGETASRADPAALVRKLAARMQRPQGV